MNNFQDLTVSNGSDPLPMDRSLVPYSRRTFAARRFQDLGRDFKSYAATHLTLRPALPALALAGIACAGSTVVYLMPEIIGDVVAAKIVAFILLMAGLYQLVVSTLRSLAVPLLGFAIAFAGLKISQAGALPEAIDPAVFQIGLIALSIGVVARCVLLSE